LRRKDIEARLGKEIKRFKPSAASINPLTGDVLIVSSINKLLVIATRELVVKEVLELGAEIFKQPEGLCFTPNGDLLISNESAQDGKANLLIFKVRGK
jgi:hypothetical protein